MGRKKRRTRKMNGAGSITKLSGNRSKPWMVRTAGELQIDGTIKRTILGYYATSEEAEIALAKYKLNPFNIDEKDTTLGELFDIWIKEKEKTIKKRSYQRYTTGFNKYFNHIAKRPIRSLRFTELQQIVSLPVTGTSKNLKIILNGVYNLAVKNNIVDKDISTLLTINKDNAFTLDKTLFDNDLIKKIRDYSNNGDNEIYVKIADMLLIMLYSGMRAGEIRDIKKDNVFLDENYLIAGIKTEAGKDRVIPIHPKIKDLIIKYYNQTDKDYVFPQQRFNKPMAEITFIQRYHTFRDILNFTHHRHITRHTFISAMKKLNVSDSKLKRIVGHRTSDVTDGVYTHYEPKDLFIEIKKLDYGD